MAVVMGNREAGCRGMYMGERFAGEEFFDVMGNCTSSVTVDETGWAGFCTEGKAVSVWIRKSAFEDLIVNE